MANDTHIHEPIRVVLEKKGTVFSCTQRQGVLHKFDLTDMTAWSTPYPQTQCFEVPSEDLLADTAIP